MKSSHPLIAFFIAKKIPASYFESEYRKSELTAIVETLDPNSKSMSKNRLLDGQ